MQSCYHQPRRGTWLVTSYRKHRAEKAALSCCTALTLAAGYPHGCFIWEAGWGLLPLKSVHLFNVNLPNRNSPTGLQQVTRLLIVTSGNSSARLFHHRARLA